MALSLWRKKDTARRTVLFEGGERWFRGREPGPTSAAVEPACIAKNTTEEKSLDTSERKEKRGKASAER